VFLHRCRNPFGGPTLLATFHNCSVTKGANDKQDVNSNQIRRTESRLLPAEGSSRKNPPRRSHGRGAATRRLETEPAG
jgi:hypothetical protein